MITHTTVFVKPVVEHWLEREIAQWVHMRDRSDDPSNHERTLLPKNYISLLHLTPTYIHTHIHTYTHTYIHTHAYIHTHIHTYIRTYMDVSVAEWLAWLTSNCGRIGAIGSSPSNGLRPNMWGQKGFNPLCQCVYIYVCIVKPDIQTIHKCSYTSIHTDKTETNI